MYILSVDTTAKTAAVCVAKDDALTGIAPVVQFSVNDTVTHSESLLPLIDRALEFSGIGLSDISAIAVTAGPGSFTGVRIGVSVVKGLAFASGGKIPCIPLSTLYCLALNVSSYGDGTVVCPLMDARREQFYNAVFRLSRDVPERLCGDRVVTAKELLEELSDKYSGCKIVICGDGARLFYGLYQKYIGSDNLNLVLAHPGDMLQNAFSVAYAGHEIIMSSDFSVENYSGEALCPTYLRLSQAERERNERLKKEKAEN